MENKPSQGKPDQTPLQAIRNAFRIAFVTVRQFSNYSLRTKLIISFLAVTIIPLVILGVYTNINDRALLTKNTNQFLTSQAQLTALQLDTFFGNQTTDLFVEAQQPALREYLSTSPGLRASSPAESASQDALNAFARKDTVFIVSYALLDLKGKNLLDSLATYQGRNESDFEYFKRTVAMGNVVFHGVSFDENNHAKIYICSPVRDKNSNIIGVLRVEYDASIFQFIVNSTRSSESNSEDYATVIDKETLIRVVDTASPNKAYKTLKAFTPEQISTFQTQGRMLTGKPQDVMDLEDQYEVDLQNLNSSLEFKGSNSSLGGNTINVGSPINSMPWVVIVSQSEKNLFSILDTQTNTLVIIALVLIVLSVLAATLASQSLSKPIIALTAVAEKITDGDLSARAIIKTRDEVGLLANSFNRMTDQLNLTLIGLEQRVSDRTVDLKNAIMVSEKRAQELQAISEISRTISTEQRLVILLPLVTRLVSERFDFYHVGIFFVDTTKQFAILQASNSEGGKRMLDRGHRLEVGLTGIVGTVAQTGNPRIALDVGSDATFFENSDLPETRSEMALPLNFRGETIGVLDVQSTKPGAFTESDANTLSILADQTAIAIENARLFGQTQQAREEAEALYNQFLRTEWKTVGQQETTIGYRQSTIGGKPLIKLIDTEEIREALQKGQVVVFDGKNLKAQPSISLPVKLRGQTIGVLNIKAPTKNRKWNQDEINLAQAVSDRLALALDNARLLQESQRRASKEAKIGEVTAKIGASINMRNVLQTAVEELGRALPGSEVIIQFQDSQEN